MCLDVHLIQSIFHKKGPPITETGITFFRGHMLASKPEVGINGQEKGVQPTKTMMSNQYLDNWIQLDRPTLFPAEHSPNQAEGFFRVADRPDIAVRILQVLYRSLQPQRVCGHLFWPWRCYSIYDTFA